MMKYNILVVDDNKEHNDIITESLRSSGLNIFQAFNAEDALKIAESTRVDICFTDLVMPGMDGIELMQKLKATDNAEVVIITGYGTVENAVDAMKKGAYTYLVKPVNLDEIRAVLKRLIEKLELQRANRELKKRIDSNFNVKNIIGNSSKMRRVYELIRRVSETDATVLIQGESGTGKELAANAIHQESVRADKPFVAVNCASISQTLLESELFGHIKGAFTGAERERQGFFEYANGGTLFLDEIGEMPLELQPKILRALEERQIIKVGSTKPIEIDIRLIAATNKDLLEMVKQGKFREDLYYRLNVVNIILPPLRERRSDIIILANYFLAQFNGKYGKNIESIDPDVIKTFYEYAWPGNVRELRNCIESMVVLTRGRTLSASDIPPYIGHALNSISRITYNTETAGASAYDIGMLKKEAIARALNAAAGNRKTAARALGISERTLYRKIKEYGLN